MTALAYEIGSKRHRSWNQVGLLLLVVLVGSIILIGCKRDSQIEYDPSTGEHPTSIEFTAGGPDVFYARVFEDGKASRTIRLSELSFAERLAVVVLIPNVTPDFRDWHYVADLTEVPLGQVTTATLRTSQDIRNRIDAGEHAVAVGLAVNANAESHVKRIAVAARAAAAATSKKTARKVQPGERIVQPTIEIEHINQASGRQGAREVALGSSNTGGWKPVTVYYADWCGVCRTAMQWLRANGVPHRAVDIEASKANKAEMHTFIKVKGGRGSIPTFRIGNEIMQGWNSQRFEQLARR